MTATLTEFRDLVGYFNYSIVESDNGSGRIKVRGVFQRADAKNGNGRIYSEALWNRVLSDKSLQETIRSRGMTGEVEHPDDGVTKLSRVSHIVTKLEKKGKEIIGEAELLDTPSGKILQELFRAGVRVGISSRGAGTSVNKEGVEYVNESNFQLKTFDFVAEPSTFGAFPEVAESKYTGPYREDASMTQKIDELRRLHVRSGEIREALKHNSIDESSLARYASELTEMREMATTLNVQLKDDEKGSQEARETLDRINEVRSTATVRLHAICERQSNDLEVEVRSLSESSNNEGSAKHSQELAEALNKAMRLARFWKDRSIELTESQDDEGSVYKAKYEAAVSLLVHMNERFGVLGIRFADLEARHEVLSERHEAAIMISTEVVARHDRARILGEVRKAIEADPRLSRFESTLLRCEDLSEVQEQVVELSRALEGLAEADDSSDSEDDTKGSDEEPDDEKEKDKEESLFDPMDFESFEEELNEDISKQPFRESAPGDRILNTKASKSSHKTLVESRDPRHQMTGKLLAKRGWK